MARAPKKVDNPGHSVTDADTPALPAIVETANQVAAADAVIMDAMETLKAIGRIEAFQFVATVADRVIAETYVKIKESKTYKGLPYRNAGGKVATVATLEEFCEAFMPKSYRRCEELANNLHLLGTDLYEQSEEMGLRQRDYNAIKALPSDQQAIIKQAVAAKDKDAVIELLQDMAVKFDKERTASEKKLSDLQADHEALDKIVAKKEAAITEKEKLIHKLQNKSGDWHPRAFEICAENTRIASGMLEGFDKLDQIRDAILNEDFGEGDREAAIEAMAVVHYDALNQIVGRAAEVMAACDEVFIGHKDKPRPMLEVFAPQGA